MVMEQGTSTIEMVYVVFSIQQSYVRTANFYSFHEQTLILAHQHRQENTLKETCMKGIKITGTSWEHLLCVSCR